MDYRQGGVSGGPGLVGGGTTQGPETAGKRATRETTNLERKKSALCAMDRDEFKTRRSSTETGPEKSRRDAEDEINDSK